MISHKLPAELAAGKAAELAAGKAADAAAGVEAGRAAGRAVAERGLAPFGGEKPPPVVID
ncbi:MAG: hypothetical protein QF410_15010 [Planctomycetota bacterium]|nr:hypothetical protein [Planctomycetota bacterium]